MYKPDCLFKQGISWMRTLLAYTWITTFVILVAIGYFVYKDQQNTELLRRVKLLSQEYKVEQVTRITLCSSREFEGKTATGRYSGTNQIAVSRDLEKYLGWYALLPTVSDELFIVSDLTNSRFRATVDIYTYQPVSKAKEFGVKAGPVLFISKKGLTVLGGL